MQPPFLNETIKNQATSQVFHVLPSGVTLKCTHAVAEILEEIELRKPDVRLFFKLKRDKEMISKYQ